jgi:alpha-L-arabinofuranosidase
MLFKNQIQIMNRDFSGKNFALRFALFLAAIGGFAAPARAETTTNPIPTLEIQANQVTAKVSPTLYGLMTEEINYSYEGGLYAQLVRNCAFKASSTEPVCWSAMNGSISLDTNQPLNSALNVSLKLDTSRASKDMPAGIVNGGYWGIPVRPNTTYHASFYARGKYFNGPLTVSLVHVVDRNNMTIKTPPGFQALPGQATLTVASATVPRISSQWRKYEVTLKTGDVPVSKDNQLVISTTKPGTFWHRHGTIWFQEVSLFPPTYDDQPNGFRPDLMKLLAAMHPTFLRFPGGNYLEGNRIAERFDWKKTIGPLDERPGHESPWGYWSTDGMGLLDFLKWCQDLHMQPVLAVYAGYSLNHTHIKPGPDLEPYVQSALEEIEYVTGDTNTTWGAQRAKDGHPAPFRLHYVEVGNEDEFDRSGSYNERFKQFYDAIKAKYPQIQVIATTRVRSCTPDLIDEHFYRSLEEMEAGAHQYDHRPRTGPKVFVGEWATREGSPTPDMAGALGDAAWLTGLERNSDLVVMASYAPLFVNVSDLARGGSMQWRCDLIGYDALRSYGSPSYYVQKMFSRHHGDEVLATRAENIPTRAWQPPARRRRGFEQPRPAPRQLDQLFFDATRNGRTGTVYVKVVNCLDTPQPVKFEISGCSLASNGKAIVLKGKSLRDTNSIHKPRNIVPVKEDVTGLNSSFTRTFPPYSITVLELRTSK